MTPTELDAIFRAWRDDWFAKNPDKSDWIGPEVLLIDSLAFGIEGLRAYDIAHAVLLHASATGQAQPYGRHLDWLVLRPINERFSFTDPPPLPAGVPIPFPAGKALLTKSAPETYAELAALAERLRKELSMGPETGRYVWFPNCPTCGGEL